MELPEGRFEMPPRRRRRRTDVGETGKADVGEAAESVLTWRVVLMEGRREVARR